MRPVCFLGIHRYPLPWDAFSIPCFFLFCPEKEVAPKPATFEKMLAILQKEYDALQQKGGKPPKLTVHDKLCIALKRLREYPTMDSIAAEYSVCTGDLPVNPMGGRHPG
jgi:hypothetical protein